MSLVKLFRIKHYVKNLLIFFPIIYAGKLFELDSLFKVLIVFITFSLTASIVYIFNDIVDVEQDRLHENKKHRPIASGEISIKTASIIAFIILLISSIISFLFLNFESIFLIAIYLTINILYTLRLKLIPIIELFVIVLGFLIRVLIGGLIIELTITGWLFLTVLSMALYLAIGKRRNELSKTGSNTREVLGLYNYQFLDKFLYVALTMTLVFYSLWTVTYENIFENNFLIWTIPLVMAITMKYSLIIESNSDGDPAEVLFSDKTLLSMVIMYVLAIFLIFYSNLVQL